MCDYTQWDQKLVTQHMDKVHRGIRVQCEICPALFTKRNNMIHHMKTVHTDKLIETGVTNPSLSFSKRFIYSKMDTTE